LVRALRNSVDGAASELMKLWSPDGKFEFCGASPVTATFEGAAAIQTLYKNRFNSCGMDIELEGQNAKSSRVTLGNVDTQVLHIKNNGSRAVVGWRTTIGTKEGHGFDVAGAHLFTFEGDKIKNVRVTVSPKADESMDKSLNARDLSVSDVGRLSLAAWAVV